MNWAQIAAFVDQPVTLWHCILVAVLATLTAVWLAKDTR